MTEQTSAFRATASDPAKEASESTLCSSNTARLVLCSSHDTHCPDRFCLAPSTHIPTANGVVLGSLSISSVRRARTLPASQIDFPCDKKFSDSFFFSFLAVPTFSTRLPVTRFVWWHLILLVSLSNIVTATFPNVVSICIRFPGIAESSDSPRSARV